MQCSHQLGEVLEQTELFVQFIEQFIPYIKYNLYLFYLKICYFEIITTRVFADLFALEYLQVFCLAS